MQAVGASSFSRSPELNSFLPQEGYHGVTRASLLSASSRKSTDISLVTAEGDKVTISAKSALQAGLVSYDYRGRLNGNEVSLQGQSFQLAAENFLEIAVEGDLSKEELADIKKLVAKIEKLGSDFFSQPLEDSPSQSLDFGNLDSIASFEANLHYEQQITVAQQVQEESSASAPTENAQPSPEPVGNSSSPAPTPVANHPEAPKISAGSVQKFVNKLLDEVKDSRLGDDKAGDKASKLLSQIFKKLAKDLQLDEPKQKLADHLHDKVAQGLKGRAEKETAQAELV